MWNDDLQEEPLPLQDSNSTMIEPELSEIASRRRPSGSGYSLPPATHFRTSSPPPRTESASSIAHTPRRNLRTPSQIDRKRISPRPTGISPTISNSPSNSLSYSEDIPPMEEEGVRDMRWVGFVTLVDQRGGRYRQRSSAPIAYGGFSDVWQCDALFADGSNVVVAVKKLRAVKLPPGLDDSQTNKRLLGRLKKELLVWMRLQHPNVAPLLGFTFDGEIAIISPWFSRGNISDYLAAHPEADRMLLIRGVASGLEHLHSLSPVVVHGDMKPDNVLIDRGGRPRIIDFGLSKIVEEEPGLSSLRSASLQDVGNARWIAPELLLEAETSRSRQTDMFSFGCVALFIFTGDAPFKSILDGQLVIARYKGASPIQDGATYPNLDVGSALMEVLRACWSINPQARPEIGDVVKRLDPTHPDSEPLAKRWACSNVGLSDGAAPQPPTVSEVPPPPPVGCAFPKCRVKRISKSCSMHMCPRHCNQTEAGCRVHTIGVVGGSVRSARTTRSKRGVPTASEVPPPPPVRCVSPECRVKRISKSCSMHMCPRHCNRTEAGCRVHTIGVVRGSVRSARTTR